MSKVIKVVYKNSFEAKKAVKLLRHKGCDPNKISTIIAENPTKNIRKKTDMSIPILKGIIFGILAALVILLLISLSPFEFPILLIANKNSDFVIILFAAVGLGCLSGGLIGLVAELLLPRIQAGVITNEFKRGNIMLNISTDNVNTKFIKNIIKETDYLTIIK